MAGQAAQLRGAGASQTLLGEVADTLKGTEIDWLDDIKAWNRDKLEQLSQGGGLNEAEIATLAVVYTANDVLFPTGLLDISPQGKGVKAAAKAKKLGASSGEITQIGSKVKPLTQAQREMLIPWKRFEQQTADHAFKDTPGAIQGYKPVRSSNIVNGVTLETGFDHAVVFRDGASKLDVKIIETKCWSKSNNLCDWSDLTALGSNTPDILRQNKNALIKAIDDLPLPKGMTVPEWNALKARIATQNDFHFVLYGLPETNFAKTEIETALKQLGFKNVEFKNVPLQ